MIPISRSFATFSSEIVAVESVNDGTSSINCFHPELFYDHVRSEDYLLPLLSKINRQLKRLERFPRL
jgi:hypothetical protein